LKILHELVLNQTKDFHLRTERSGIKSPKISKTVIKVTVN